MTPTPEMLSAYLDCELAPEDVAVVEEALARDPELAAELARLQAADALARAEFAEELNEPIPAALTQAIEGARVTWPANLGWRPRFAVGLSALAASVALIIGGAGGYYTRLQDPVQVVAARGWLDDIADYHRVYSGQKRHLVEVPASEADHIETWLTNTVGAEVRVPDLSAEGLTFQGGRLLVAVGKPVAQLMFTDASGGVVALCVIRSDSPQATQAQRSSQGFDMVSWGGTGANFVVVGDAGRSDLQTIAARIADAA